jgi:2-polyprenyl-6-methoxyphenol hydroxylase-like FAD-dependent oxidoreductase
VGFSAHRETLALPANFETLDGEDLKSSVIALMGDWHPALRHLVQAAEAPTVTAFPIKTSVPIGPWRTRNVTLLGDALHNMTPFRGIGANTALRDAAALRRALRAADRGEEDLISALAAYEREMIDYGFQAVRMSLRNMRHFHSEGILARVFTRSLFRVIDRVPPFKAAFLGH